MTEIGNAAAQTCGRWLNNRAENSHQPFRRRERAMAGFKSGRAEGTCDWTRNSLVEVDGQLDDGDRIPPSGGL